MLCWFADDTCREFLSSEMKSVYVGCRKSVVLLSLCHLARYFRVRLPDLRWNVRLLDLYRSKRQREKSHFITGCFEKRPLQLVYYDLSDIYNFLGEGCPNLAMPTEDCKVKDYVMYLCAADQILVQREKLRVYDIIGK